MKNKSKKKNNTASSQVHLPISEIRDGVVILKDGTMRSVLLTSSINFALKSEDEQNALISSYVSFLNSLDFPLQIVVQSRQLQMKPYLEKLIDQEKNQTNELLRIQTADYRAFISELVELGNIMKKQFYVIVPYDARANNKKSYWERIKEVIKPGASVKLKEEKFRQRKEDLDLRIRKVLGGLQGMGLEVVPLNTQALIELYYTSFNPDIAFHEDLADLNELRVEDI